MDDAQFLKRSIKTGSIDVHPTECALLINYRVDVTVVKEDGDRLFGHKKKFQKMLHIKNLDNATNTKALAEDIVQKCQILDRKRLPEIEQHLYYLQNRRTSADSQPKISALTAENDLSSRSSTSSLSFYSRSVNDRADMANLSLYIDMLYEDVAEKVKGTSFIADLASDSENLEELMQNETLIGALARIFREDWKKSLECSVNIAFIFLCFSNYDQFHQMISHFKIGALCMQILEYEIKRYQSFVTKRPQSSNDFAQFDEKEADLLIKKQNQFYSVGIRLLFNLAQEKDIEIKIVNRGIVDILCQILHQRLTYLNESSGEIKPNQDLLSLLVEFLKKLSVFAENVIMMAEHKVVEQILRVLTVLPRNERLAENILRLLFNLSFDFGLRRKMCNSEFLAQVVPYLGNERLSIYTLPLLYHISMEDKCKSIFAQTDCIPMCIRMLLSTDERLLIETIDSGALCLKIPTVHSGDNLFISGNDDESVTDVDRFSFRINCALLINLSLNKRNAQLIAGDDMSMAKCLIEKALFFKNSLLANLLRNMACHSGPLKLFFVEYLSDLANAVKRADFTTEERDVKATHQNFSLECLGILTNLNLTDLNFSAFLNESGLLAWLLRQLKSSMHADDNAMLEIVMYLGTVSADSSGAELLLRNGVVKRLINILTEKQESDEIVLQIIYVFYPMMLHESTRPSLLDDADIPTHLIELMHDKNINIRKMCDNILELIAEHGVEWAQKIQEEKFRWHNAQWLDIVANSAGSSSLRQFDQMSIDYSASESDVDSDSDFEVVDSRRDDLMSTECFRLDDESGFD